MDSGMVGGKMWQGMEENPLQTQFGMDDKHPQFTYVALIYLATSANPMSPEQWNYAKDSFPFR